jgi:hypothetical protein
MGERVALPLQTAHRTAQPIARGFGETNDPAGNGRGVFGLSGINATCVDFIHPQALADAVAEPCPFSLIPMPSAGGVGGDYFSRDSQRTLNRKKKADNS